MLRDPFPIRNGWIGNDQPAYVIAEMACSHDGEIDRAKRIIDAAVEAGADAIQLQLFRQQQQVPPRHYLYPLLGYIEFGPEDWEAVFLHARQQEIAVFAFTYDLPSMELALAIGADAIKLSSADLSTPYMLEAAAQSGLPLTLGTGASTLQEISAALALLSDEGADAIVLMHGVQNFPTRISDAQIRRIRLLQQVYQLPVGYQDHTDASLPLSQTIDLVAVGMGACIIEKHITLDREEKGLDYQAALEPAEFTQFVNRIKQASEALGPNGLTPLSESDYRYRRFQKKHIVASVAIEEGALIKPSDLAFLRNDSIAGLSPMNAHQVIGKTAVHDILPYEPIRSSDIAEPALNGS